MDFFEIPTMRTSDRKNPYCSMNFCRLVNTFLEYY